MLCGCTIASMRSDGSPKSQCASMSSRALFISVALSIVILRPICQVGCRSASAGVAAAVRSAGQVRKGPPLAVITTRSSSSTRPERMHCASALCSESMGKSCTPFAATRDMTRSPAATRVSLLASARWQPSSIARRALARPAKPTIAATSRSPGRARSSTSRSADSAPVRACSDDGSARAASASAIATSRTPSARACSASSAAFDPAARPTTSKATPSLRRCRSTSTVLTPMLPVLPSRIRRRMATVQPSFFIASRAAPGVSCRRPRPKIERKVNFDLAASPLDGAGAAEAPPDEPPPEEPSDEPDAPPESCDPDPPPSTPSRRSRPRPPRRRRRRPRRSPPSPS